MFTTFLFFLNDWGHVVSRALTHDDFAHLSLWCSALHRVMYETVHQGNLQIPHSGYPYQMTASQLFDAWQWCYSTSRSTIFVRLRPILGQFNGTSVFYDPLVGSLLKNPAPPPTGIGWNSTSGSSSRVSYSMEPPPGLESWSSSRSM